jgi:4-hydroxybenzoate polyprenyltransferase/phosphoserine phosphatase
LRRDLNTIPLAVDLDGTLIGVDTLHEGFVQCLKYDSMSVVNLARNLHRGKAAFKRFVASVTEFDPSALPYNEALLDYLRIQRRTGRKIGLFTAADQSIAEKIAAHLGLFDIVKGSDGLVDLRGTRKAEAIREAFGNRFAYAGDARADMPIFEVAERVILVGPVELLRQSHGLGAKIEAAFPVRRPTVTAWLKALRPQHWAKNMLVFVPAVLGIQVASWLVALDALILFAAMGAMASAAYIINDLFDLAADRAHRHKRFRPFASGEIPVIQGMLGAAGLMLFGLGLGLLLPRAVLGALIAYAAITLAYSIRLKRQPMIDVIILAGLFTLRVLAGSLIMLAPVSPWLLTFSMVFFLGLTMVKRYAELEGVLRAGATAAAARGYTEKDLPLLLATGIASGVGAIVVFMIYMITEQYRREFYANPGLLWAMMPVILVWTLRVWHQTVHGQMEEDPVMFALQDRFSLWLGIALLCILLAAWL